MSDRRRFHAFLCCLLALAAAAPQAAAEPRFEGYDIRVIRPRYFVKTGRPELSAGVGAIVNQTFIYSFVATGLVTWHFSETIALEAQGAYALNTDRDDKTALDARFAIKTILLRPETLLTGRFVWTPSYGKFHLTSSDIVYFDTHVTLGAGTTGIRYLYDHCDDPSKVPEAARDRVPVPPAPRREQYPTYLAGIGQRYFLSKSASVRLGLELQRFVADRAHGACDTGAPSAMAPTNNLLLFTAWSYYL